MTPMNKRAELTKGHPVAVDTSTTCGGVSDATLRHIEAALRGLQFGSVTVTVQDGVVVQIERTEKTRLGRLPSQGRQGA